MMIRIAEKWINRSIGVMTLNIGYILLALSFWVPIEAQPLSWLVLLFNLVLVYILFNLVGDQK